MLLKLTNVAPGAPNVEEKRQILIACRALSPDAFDAEVVKVLNQLGAGMHRATQLTEELRRRVELLIGKLWYPAIFLHLHGREEDRRAMVLHGGTARVVGVSDAVELESLVKGCQVMLNHELTALVAPSEKPFPNTGEIATVVEAKPASGSLILRSRDEELEVETAASLDGVDLKPGDRVRWVRWASLAYEKITDSRPPRFQIEETPNVSLDEVGGQDENVELLMHALSSALVAPDMAAQYGLSGRCSTLIEGPPGCGKTLMVRAAVSEISRRNGRKAKFFVVKPAEWESCFVGGTEANIRELFTSLRDATKDGSMVILFLDEIDAVGKIRGNFQGHHSDKALNALLAEMDGFLSREGVAVVATTNRGDTLDGALWQRLSDHVLRVLPPDRAGARAIFEIHLPRSRPFSPNGSEAMATRNELIELAIGRVYSPNSAFSEIARIKFRDGPCRVVSARDLARGRLFAQICRDACSRAFRREQSGGEGGIRVADMEEALSAAILRVAQNLTIHNIRNQLSGLPTDLEIVAVECLLKRVKSPHRYLRAG